MQEKREDRCGREKVRSSIPELEVWKLKRKVYAWEKEESEEGED